MKGQDVVPFPYTFLDFFLVSSRCSQRLNKLRRERDIDNSLFNLHFYLAVLFPLVIRFATITLAVFYDYSSVGQ